MTDASEAVGAYVEAQLSQEWERKASFDTRALALAAGNVGLVALVFAVAGQTSLLSQLRSPPSSCLLRVALAAVAAGTALAIAATTPGNYAAPTIAAVKKLAELALAGEATADECQEALLRARLKELEAAARANAVKAVLTWLSLLALGVAAVMFAAALTWAS